MQVHDRRMRAWRGPALAAPAHSACTGLTLHAGALPTPVAHGTSELRCAPRPAAGPPGLGMQQAARATSCACACCQHGPATRWCWRPRPLARPPASCCMRGWRCWAPADRTRTLQICGWGAAAGLQHLAARLLSACTAVTALLRHRLHIQHDVGGLAGGRDLQHQRNILI